jgi:hypothetical protein
MCLLVSPSAGCSIWKNARTPLARATCRHVVDGIEAAVRQHGHGDDLDADRLRQIDGLEHAIVRARVALMVVQLLRAIERDADEVQLGDHVELLAEVPAVGVHGHVDAARLQVVDDLADVLPHERLATHYADAHHARIGQLVDGAVPVGGAHLVAVHVRQVAVVAAEVALVGEGHGDHEGELPPGGAGEREARELRSLARHRRGLACQRANLLPRESHVPILPITRRAFGCQRTIHYGLSEDARSAMLTG